METEGHLPEQTSPSQNVDGGGSDGLNTKQVRYFLIMVLIVSMLSTGYLFLENKSLKKKLNQMGQSDTTMEQTTPSVLPSPQIIFLPEIVELESSFIPPKSWREVTHEGFTFSLPSDWRFTASTIENWPEPISDAPPLPLSGSQSKWDAQFTPVFFESEDQFFASLVSEAEIETIEKVITQNNLTIYFVTGSTSFYGDESQRVPVVGATIIKGDAYYRWFGYSGENGVNAETLKNIVKTIRIIS